MTVFVISAPSGAGKTTLNRRLLKELPQLAMSVSHTTRAPRPGEVDGEHYHFTNQTAFEKMAKNQEFIEWANVHGNLYGTSFHELERIKQLGKTPILEIDVQGWEKVKPLLQDAVSVFILPPSLRLLWDRLESRGSDSLEVRWKRFQNAYEEIQNANHYDSLIVNNELEKAYHNLRALVLSSEPKKAGDPEGQDLCRKLNEEFQSAEWIRELRQKMKI
jgi:guanylate kinase